MPRLGRGRRPLTASPPQPLTWHVQQVAHAKGARREGSEPVGDLLGELRLGRRLQDVNVQVQGQRVGGRQVQRLLQRRDRRLRQRPRPGAVCACE